MYENIFSVFLNRRSNRGEMMNNLHQNPIRVGRTAAGSGI
jgi:hypothetical protein